MCGIAHENNNYTDIRKIVGFARQLYSMYAFRHGQIAADSYLNENLACLASPTYQYYYTTLPTTWSVSQMSSMQLKVLV